jgi:hypothetical protein
MTDSERFNIVTREIVGKRLTWDQFDGKDRRAFATATGVLICRASIFQSKNDPGNGWNCRAPFCGLEDGDFCLHFQTNCQPLDNSRGPKLKRNVVR